MTAPIEERVRLTPGNLIAQEIRAELGRQGITQATLARRMGVTQVWVSSRIGRHITTSIRVDDVCEIAEALDVPVEGLLDAWLCACRDSNPKPSVLEPARLRLIVNRIPAGWPIPEQSPMPSEPRQPAHSLGVVARFGRLQAVS